MTIGSSNIDRERSLKALRERVLRYRNGNDEERRNPLYWVNASAQPGVGTFYMMVPGSTSPISCRRCWSSSRISGWMSLFSRASLPVVATIISEKQNKAEQAKKSDEAARHHQLQ